MTLLEGNIGETYMIKEKSCVVVIKDGRYNIDNMLAEAVIV